MSGLSEFSLIKRYFQNTAYPRNDVLLGIGDDCAIVQSKPEHQVAISVDTLVEGVHFSADVEPASLGHKSLAVSLSDLAAMGATPAWFTLALTLPDVNEVWLADFAKGLAGLANQHKIALIGGDTTRGPLSITVQVHGIVKIQDALMRNNAKAGDGIYVSGTLGDAGAALKLKQRQLKVHSTQTENVTFLNQRLDKPTPRVELGQNIAGIANAAIDISDGLVADLGHILEKSGVGAEVNLESLPISKELANVVTREQAEQLALYSGDDYELCFTVASEHEETVRKAIELPYAKIGTITETNKVVIKKHGQEMTQTGTSYEHFSA